MWPNKKYEYEDVVYAELDVDDTSSYGPETITLIKPIIDGTYKYSVHDYSNDSGEQVALDANREMALSGAVVKVYKGTELLRTYQVPTDQTGIVWNVFELKNDVITTLNTMTGEYDAIFMTY